METGQIIDALRAVKHTLPKAAIEAATADRARHAPEFIAAFERYSDSDASDASAAEPLFFMYHLLGEWRETDAYRPLCRFLRGAPDRVGEVLGDAVTTTAHRVVSACFDGDPQPMFDVVRDANADEYVRWNMCETLAHLVLEGRLDRAIVVRFLRDCFSHMQPQRACHVWDGWVTAVAKLGLVEFRSLVEMVYTRRYASAGVSTLQHFESDLASASDPAAVNRWLLCSEYTPFTGTLAEMSTWYGFSEAARREERRAAIAAAAAKAEGVVVSARSKPPGRNDSCPCGSGKKYKKCCLN